MKKRGRPPKNPRPDLTKVAVTSDGTSKDELSSSKPVEPKSTSKYKRKTPKAVKDEEMKGISSFLMTLNNKEIQKKPVYLGTFNFPLVQ